MSSREDVALSEKSSRNLHGVPWSLCGQHSHAYRGCVSRRQVKTNLGAASWMVPELTQALGPSTPDTVTSGGSVTTWTVQERPWKGDP